MSTTCRKGLLRIKSPQLYRLSYQPELLESLGKASCQGSVVGAIVPVVCPGLFPDAKLPHFIGGTVVASWLLGVAS